MTSARSAADIAALAQLACLLEVSAPKPGNVSPGRHFADLTYEDFLTSAVAIGPAFTRVADQPVGETIRQAIEMTACWTKTNTNLGIVLLLAPLARAVTRGESGELRRALRRVLDEMTITDPALYEVPIKVTQRFRRAEGAEMSDGSVSCLMDQWRQDLERRNQALAGELSAEKKGARP